MCSAAAAAHSAALPFAPGGIQSTRNDLGLMQEDVFVLNAAVWLCTTFVTARFSRGPEQAEGCAAAERAVCKLGSPEKGKTLKREGKVLDSKQLLSLLAAPGRRRLLHPCSSLRRHITPLVSYWQCSR